MLVFCVINNMDSAHVYCDETEVRSYSYKATCLMIIGQTYGLYPVDD